jgi:hypothetical protein
MAKRAVILAAGLLASLAALAVSSLVRGDDPAGTAPAFRYGLDVRVRKAGEKDYTDKTEKVGLEFYLDGANGNGVYIADAGDITALSAKLVGPAPAAGKVPAPQWSHAMDLQARKADEKVFSAQTTEYGVEVIRDDGAGAYLYIDDAGPLSAFPAASTNAKTGADVKDPDWKNGMSLRVRKAGDADFNDKTPKIGIETFLDPNNGNIVYISQSGSIAVLPAKQVKIDESAKGKPADWKHGMELAARKSDEKVFSKDTKRYGVEVFFDPYAGGVLYVSETGSIAVVPASLCALPDAVAKVKAPDWKRAMVLGCRKAGESDFKTAKRFGVEVFLDPNTGNTVYISETGSLAVVPGKDPA